MADDVKQSDRKFPPVVIVGVIIALALVAFVVQNSHKVKVHWLFFSVTAPLYLTEFVTIVASIVAAELIAVAIRRRRRPQ